MPRSDKTSTEEVWGSSASPYTTNKTVHRIQRNFEPLRQQVEPCRVMQLSTAAAKLLIYQAFIEEETGFPKHLARRVHELYFQPLRFAMRKGR